MPSSDAVRDAAWRLLLAAAAHRRLGTLPAGPCGLHAGANGALVPVTADDGGAALRREADGAFTSGPALSETQRELVELYLPLLGRGDGASYVIGHLGQSADARIATVSGHSQAVTGHADFVHMHRLRALSDAVLVGAGTVAADDPALTTRLVAGPNPLRVVVDPRSRLGGELGVFRDGAAPTLRVRAADGSASDEPGVLSVPEDADGLSLEALLEALRARGAHIVFIEGGGVTVTRWMTAGLLDRLHLVAAPVLVGDGRAALELPGVATMDEALRPPCRLYRLGRDVLWDFDLRGERMEEGSCGSAIERLF